MRAISLIQVNHGEQLRIVQYTQAQTQEIKERLIRTEASDAFRLEELAAARNPSKCVSIRTEVKAAKLFFPGLAPTERAGM